jgi:uncharacterized membrane protein YfcA
METHKRYKKGYFIEVGLAAGIPIGIPVGLMLGNIAFGPMIGVLIGLAAGYLAEKILNKDPVDLTEKEKKKKAKFALTGIITGLVFFLTMVIYLYI